MRIKVQAQKITSNPTDFTKKSMKLVLNKTSENIASQFAEKLKDMKCEIHKANSRGTITIIPNLNTNKLELKSSNFCCKEFENRIDLKQ